MAEAFIRKRKDKERRPRVASARVAVASSTNAPSPASSTLNGVGGRPSPAPSGPGGPSLKSEPDAVKSEPNPHVQEIKIYSSGASRTGLRYNIMRLNSAKDIDPKDITVPILMNRKRPGPRAPPIFATDGEGKIIGKFVYDNEGKQLLDAEGQPVIERKADNSADMSLVGHAPGTEAPQERKRKMKKGTKEVFHQDIEIMRLRREEALPWVMESAKPKEKPTIPEHWVGRMIEASTHPKVLLMNDGTGEGFEMIPLGRTYRFDPERPFKLLDPDAANKLFEHQAKHKIHDRWSLRPEGPNQMNINGGGEGSTSRVKVEREMEERAARMEGRIRQLKGLNIDRKPKVERYDDDYRREGRMAERGLEGGIDEELDFDEAEGFQDDDDNNTFYRDVNEEEEAKELEERLKKEFRLANTNVGDRPQIAADDDEDDLFGDNELNDEGKKLRKIMKKRREEDPNENDYMDSDEDSEESDAESVNSKATDKEKDKEKDKEAERGRNSPIPEQQPRSSSRGPGARTASPSGRRPNMPTSKRTGTAPPGSGAALVAQRAASRGASPRPHSSGRASSPLSGRAASPEVTAGGRGTSPAVRGSSPASRAASPAPPPGVRGSSPASVSGPSTRDVSPAPGSSQPSSTKIKTKRKTTSESPARDSAASSAGPSPSGKRKTSPGASSVGGEAKKPKPSTSTSSAPNGGPPKKKSKKVGSSTPTPAPEDIPPFEGMITKTEVLDWFKKNGRQGVVMSEAIGAFKSKIVESGKNRDANQKLFLGWVRAVADQKGQVLSLKEEYQ
ncbi:hypothetical protein CI109_102609 [Kwoniella shandongensis]|uniref:Uncharacterized protein n=1 Tax=Kwoniella shandongensis TaxID=1734106 RepID=A0A5M6BX15_9TREE|nr:uncharacterized protein CI109_005191 [Kwoniella shandongensis]KAA5526422.1 hypothetical protein CI109_005191 [Kwoniella shandongensis]